MPVVAVLNSKGGSGKTTSALLLAIAAANAGASVVLLDADPNAPLVRWAEGGQPISVVPVPTDSALVPAIDREAATRDLVIIDVEGSANRMTSRALTRADLVLVPMQPSSLDAEEARKTIALIREEEGVQRRAIPFVILLVRTSKVASRDERAIVKELDQKGIPRLRSMLVQRAAFAALFSKRTTLADLDPREVSGLDQARGNAAEFGVEVIAMLKAIVARRAA
jgi:chromosome partitioning protein